MSNTKLIWITPNAEKIIAYCARVSSKKQDNPNIEGLLKYCLKHNHVSIMEMASMCIEIKTTRGISSQIIRHRSFSFQEFSTRYQVIEQDLEIPNLRRQDIKNRQNSISDLDRKSKRKRSRQCDAAPTGAIQNLHHVCETGAASTPDARHPRGCDDGREKPRLVVV